MLRFASTTPPRPYSADVSNPSNRRSKLAKSLGPDHYVIDRTDFQIWNPKGKLVRNEE